MKMNDQKIDEKLRREKLFSVLSIISVVAVAIILLGMFSIWLYNIGVISLPGFIEDMLGLGEDKNTEILPGDEGKIYDALENGNLHDGQTIQYDIGKDDLLAMLHDTDKPDEYTAQYEVIRYDSKGRERISYTTVWYSGGKYRIETREAGALVQLTVYDGELVHITDKNGTGETRTYAAGDFSLESAAGIPSAESIFSDSSPENVDISLLRTSTSNIYHINYVSDGVDQYDTLYVSLEYGLVLNATVYKEDRIYYTCKTALLEPRIVGFGGNVNELFNK